MGLVAQNQVAFPVAELLALVNVAGPLCNTMFQSALVLAYPFALLALQGLGQVQGFNSQKTAGYIVVERLRAVWAS